MSRIVSTRLINFQCSIFSRSLVISGYKSSRRSDINPLRTCNSSASQVSFETNSKLRSLHSNKAATPKWNRVLTENSMNQRVKTVPYNLCENFVKKQTNFSKVAENGLCFDGVFNTASCLSEKHAMPQKPITFLRQVLAACIHPELMGRDPAVFPRDVEQRAVEVLDELPGCSLGSYSESTGYMYCRKKVKEFIELRDGFPSDVNNICISGGSTEIMKMTLNVAVFGAGKERTGIMIPTPKHPLYSAFLTQTGATEIGYCLADEDSSISLNLNELKKSYKKALKNCTPRVLCIINPNANGHGLTRKSIDDVIQFAGTHRLILMADEVYQPSTIDPDFEFCSFKKALMESEFKESLELASFHSISKGFVGECGLRSGYGEFVNFDPDVVTLMTRQMCSSSVGQVALGVILNPPKPGDESYELFVKERDAILNKMENCRRQNLQRS